MGATSGRPSLDPAAPPLLGDLESARYGLACAEEAYRRAAPAAPVGG